MLRKTAGDAHPLVTQGLSNLAALSCRRGQAAEGIALYEDVLRRQRQALAAGHKDLVATERALAECR
jgi:hypothetical protein